MITSKPKAHPWHDDRLQKTARLVAENRPGEVTVCDILDVTNVIPKAKLGGPRSPQEIGAYLITEKPTVPLADFVFLIDDVITTGGHFAACSKAIRPLFPRAQIVGVFLARQKQSDIEYGVVEFPDM